MQKRANFSELKVFCELPEETNLFSLFLSDLLSLFDLGFLPLSSLDCVFDGFSICLYPPLSGLGFRKMLVNDPAHAADLRFI